MIRGIAIVALGLGAAACSAAKKPALDTRGFEDEPLVVRLDVGGAT